MGLIRLLGAPIRGLVRFPPFQFGVVVLIIFVLQAADEKTLFGQIFDVLDRVVDATVKLWSELFKVKSFTRSGLTLGFMIAYVFVVFLLFLLIIRITFRLVIELLAWSNAFGLRNAIARERGIAAYRAWLPLERIRPSVIPQEKWEEAFAWPANNAPPYPPLARRILRVVVSYLTVATAVIVMCQVFTPFPVLTWLGRLARMAIG
jgi:hypothetical protein